jgi:predicted phosphodiesterase
MIDGKIWDRLFEEKMLVLSAIPKIADKYEVDSVVIAGDVFDNTNPPEAIKAEFVKWLNKFKVPVNIIAGNHESSSYDNNALMDIGEAFKLKSGQHAHVFIGNVNEIMYPGVGVFHLMMEGIDEHYKDSVQFTDDRFSLYNTIMLGDFHGFWHKKYGDKNFLYPGPPYPTRFGESNHSVCIVDVNSEGHLQSIKRVGLKCFTMNEQTVEDDGRDDDEALCEFVSDFEVMLEKNVMVMKLNYNNVPSDMLSEQIHTLSLVKNEKMKNPNCIDFIYSIKADKGNAIKERVNNRGVIEVGLEYITNNAPEPEETVKMFKEKMAEV